MNTRILGLLIAGMLATPLPANATTFFVQGTFSDGGTLTGSFDVSLADCSWGNVGLVSGAGTLYAGHSYGSIQSCNDNAGELLVVLTDTNNPVLFFTFTAPPAGTSLSTFSATEAFTSNLRTSEGDISTRPFAAPEPGTLALLSLGLLGLGLSRRRKT